MKTFWVFVFCGIIPFSVFGQGTVHFGNTAATLITTNIVSPPPGGPFVSPISGVGTYRFGLYVGPFGSPSPSFTLMATTTNLASPIALGRFDGGNLPLPNTGETLSFQVRGWSSFGGNTFEEAFGQASSQTFPYPLVGQSAVGFFTAPPSGTIEIFGTGPGQVGGFPLVAVIPEPSTYALSAVGFGLWWCWSRRRKARA